MGVLTQAESGPKFSHVMRAKLTEVGSSWLTQTLFLQINENKHFSYLWQRNKQSQRTLCKDTEQAALSVSDQRTFHLSSGYFGRSVRGKGYYMLSRKK